MFANLSHKLTQVFRSLSGTDRISASMLEQSRQQLRQALLEADVAQKVIDELLENFSTQALGKAVQTEAKPADVIVKLFHDKLVAILGGEQQCRLNLDHSPSVVMLVGLQGAGKTSFAARLGQLLHQQSKRVLLCSCDVYRPAAIEQLATLAKPSGCDVFGSDPSHAVSAIARAALAQARNENYDVLILDTAGRTSIDEAMMSECAELKRCVNPTELLFVLDSMTGQDAAITAKAFHSALNITGCVLTKTDGDSRGGAALSVRAITGQPIKYISTGEKLADIDNFEPERIAQRILGMGDIVGLMKTLEEKVDRKKAERLMKKITKSGQFDFADLRDQLQQMQTMDMGSMLGQIPGMSALPPNMLQDKLGTENFKPFVNIIDSMTTQERYFPNLVMNVASRRKRVLRGSGRSMAEFNQMIKAFKRMQKMMSRFKGKKLQQMMSQMQSMLGSGPSSG